MKSEIVKEELQRIESQGFDFDTLLNNANEYYDNHMLVKSKIK